MPPQYQKQKPLFVASIKVKGRLKDKRRVTSHDFQLFSTENSSLEHKRNWTAILKRNVETVRDAISRCSFCGEGQRWSSWNLVGDWHFADTSRLGGIDDSRYRKEGWYMMPRPFHIGSHVGKLPNSAFFGDRTNWVTTLAEFKDHVYSWTPNGFSKKRKWLLCLFGPVISGPFGQLSKQCNLANATVSLVVFWEKYRPSFFCWAVRDLQHCRSNSFKVSQIDADEPMSSLSPTQCHTGHKTRTRIFFTHTHT